MSRIQAFFVYFSQKPLSKKALYYAKFEFYDSILKNYNESTVISKKYTSVSLLLTKNDLFFVKNITFFTKNSVVKGEGLWEECSVEQQVKFIISRGGRKMLKTKKFAAYAIIFCILGVVMMFFYSGLQNDHLNILTPYLQEQFGWSATKVTNPSTWGSIFVIVFYLITGAAFVKFGVRKFMVPCTVCTGAWLYFNSSIFR
jgi:hypothetical protein